MPTKDGDMTQEEEEEYRRKILLRARKGDVKAQRELMEKYHMRVYSDGERAKLPTYYDQGRGAFPSSTRRADLAPRKIETTEASKGSPKKRMKTKSRR